MMKINTVVIGGGPGGYVAAIRLAQLGVETALIEQENVGGTCLNVGCIPSKALIHAAKSYYGAKNSYKRMGIQIPEVGISFESTLKWKGQVIKKLTSGILNLLKGNKVNLIEGKASFVDTHTLKVEKEGETTEIEFKNCIIATGSKPVHIPAFKVDQDKIVDSTGALSLPDLPASLAIIGGGYIGLELGMAYAKLGTKVTVVEALDTILAQFDDDVIKVIQTKLKRLRVKVWEKSSALECQVVDNQVELKLSTPKGEQVVKADHLFVSVGRRPYTEGLNLVATGIAPNEQGFIEVDKQMKTSVSHIFAIGDVVGQPMLAHKASKEGEIAAGAIAENTSLSRGPIPSIVFTDPEIASCGLSEKELQEQDIPYKKSTFPLTALGRAATTNETDGFAKILTDEENQKVLGVILVGPHTSDMIGEASLALTENLTVEQIAHTIHPHPTFGEIMMETAQGAFGQAIHKLNS